MKHIIFVFLLILDILLFTFFIIFEKYFIQVLIIHTILFILSYKIHSTFESKSDELPLSIIYFMPILGILIYFILNFSLHYFVRDNSIILEYEQLMLAPIKNQNKKRINYEREIKTMSFIDMFSYIDPEKKKELLIESQYAYKINNSKILKKGLEASDKEVQHYSATLLNSRENELTNNINYLKEQFNGTDDENILDDLIEAFSIYLHSSLIEIDSIELFRQEYIDVLTQKVKRKTYNKEILEELFKTYISTGDLYNARLINDKMKRKFGESEETKLNDINLLFKKRYLSEINYMMNNLSDKELKENHKLRELHDFFVKER